MANCGLERERAAAPFAGREQWDAEHPRELCCCMAQPGAVVGWGEVSQPCTVLWVQPRLCSVLCPRSAAFCCARTSLCTSFLSSWIKSRAAKLPVLCHVTLIASRSHHILNSCGFSEAIYLMQFAKCLRSSADSDILGLQSFAI